MLQILHALVRSNKSSDKSYLIIFIQSSELKTLRNSQLIFSLNDKYISENFPEIFHFSQYFTEIAVFIFRKYQQHHNIGNKIICKHTIYNLTSENVKYLSNQSFITSLTLHSWSCLVSYQSKVSLRDRQ